MPRVNWNVSAGTIENFDRSTQYKPYTGPIPPNGYYLWEIKTLKYVAGTRRKNPQLRVGLELVPREDRNEDQYEGYFIMAFLYVNNNTAWRYVPFLDALGVSETEFLERTITDEEGNVIKIGKWRNTKDYLILAQLKDGEDENGNEKKEVGSFAEVPEDEEDFNDEEEVYDDDE